MLQRRHNVARVVDRQCGLGQEGEIVGIGGRQRGDIVDRFDQRHRAIGQLAERTDDFGVAGVADEDDVTALFVGALGLFVDLGYQRTGRVDVVEPARFGLGRNRLGNAMRAEHDRNAIGHLIERFDENRPLRLQRFNDIAVMDDLVPDIDGGAITLDRQLDDADRPVDAGAKAAWGGHQNLEFRGFGGGLRKICHDPRALAQRP